MFVPLSLFFFFSQTFPDKIRGPGPCNLRFSFSIVTTVFQPWDSRSRNSGRKGVCLSCDPWLGLAGKRPFFYLRTKDGCVLLYPFFLFSQTFPGRELSL
uniref:Putative secreted protein n=1 Tax=Ixodes ricinus TaxID=34613 RepID=A0A6B0UI80_IXORI